jgi:hypothetical protein
MTNTKASECDVGKAALASSARKQREPFNDCEGPI